MPTIRIGTRQSDLAMTQTHMVAASLSSNQCIPEIHKVLTTGDTDYREFHKIPGDGFFTKELEKRLLKNEIDIAVHSCKDLPSMNHQSLPWFAYGEREVTEDILITPNHNILSNGKLKNGLRIGTSSPRRTLQLKKLFPTCTILQLRGNVPSRIQKAKSSDYDAVVLAEAGVSRLKLLESLAPQGLACLRLPTITAPCQGILAIQTRSDELEKLSFLKNKNLDTIAHIEKSILALFGGGCQLALGANISPEGEKYRLRFFLEDKSISSHFEQCYSNFSELLRDTFIKSLQISPKEQKIWLTQPLQHQIEVARLFKDTHLEPSPLPIMEIRPSWNYFDFLNISDNFQKFSSLVFTSRFGVRLFFMEFISCFPDAFLELHKKKIYCIGGSTESELQKYYSGTFLKPSEAKGSTLFDTLEHEKSPLIIGTKDSELKKLYDLSGRNYTFMSLYQSLRHASPLNDFTTAQNGDSVVITSPIAAENFSETYWQCKKDIRVFAFGPTTSKKLDSLKIPHTTNSISGSWEKMVEHIVQTTKR